MLVRHSSPLWRWMPDGNERGGAMTEQQAMTATTVHRRNSGSIIVAEAAARADRHRRLLAAADFAAAFVDSGEDVLARLGTDWSVAAVIIDTSLLTAELLERLCRPGSPHLIVVVDDADADAAGLALDANLADFVASDVADGDYLAAIDRALDKASATLGVADISDRSAAALGALSTEVERIAAALATLAQGERRVAAGGELPVTAVQVRAIIKTRRLRERFFPAELFSDPAWDMLLDLIAARLENKQVSVSSLCIAAAVPTTTGLRWIRTLCDSGVFIRHLDPKDARRAFITLGDAAAQSMLDYLASLRGEGPVI